MFPHKTSVLLLASLLAGAGALRAQSFEGTIRQNSMIVSAEAMGDLLWRGGQDETEYASEEAFQQAMAERFFALSQEELEALAASGTAEVESLTIEIRGKRIRVAEDPGSPFSIIDLASGAMWMVMPADHTYVEFSAADVSEARGDSEAMIAGLGSDREAAQEDGSDGVVVSPLNQTRAINGFEAQGYRASAGGKLGEAWCAADRFGLTSTLKELAEKSQAWGEEEGSNLEDAMCAGTLPVLSKSFTPSVGLFEVTEILSVEPGSLPAESFQVPEGYRKVSLSEIWGG